MPNEPADQFSFGIQSEELDWLFSKTFVPISLMVRSVSLVPDVEPCDNIVLTLLVEIQVERIWTWFRGCCVEWLSQNGYSFPVLRCGVVRAATRAPSAL